MQPNKELSTAVIFERTDCWIFSSSTRTSISALALGRANSAPRLPAHIPSAWRILSFCIVLFNQAPKLAAAGHLPGHQDQGDFVFRVKERGDVHLQQALEPDDIILQNPLKLAVATTATAALFRGRGMRRNLAPLRQNEAGCTFRGSHSYVLFISPLKLHIPVPLAQKVSSNGRLHSHFKISNETTLCP